MFRCVFYVKHFHGCLDLLTLMYVEAYPRVVLRSPGLRYLFEYRQFTVKCKFFAWDALGSQPISSGKSAIDHCFTVLFIGVGCD